MGNKGKAPERSLSVAWIKFILSIVLSIIVVFSQMVGLGIAAALNISPLLTTAAGEIVPLILAIVVMIALGGKKWIGIDKDSIKYAFKVGWIVLTIGAVASILNTINSLRKGVSLSSDSIVNLFVVLVLCLIIGFYEEYLYRGICFGGMLGVFGGSRGKILIALLISAWGFGRAHVQNFDFSSPMMIGQALLKIVQTGMFGIICCDCMLHSKKIGGAALLHAANDFLLMVTGAIFQGKSVTGQYTFDDPQQGMLVIYIYIGMILVYLYPTIRSCMRIWKEHDWEFGPFCRIREQKQAAVPGNAPQEEISDT